MANVVQYILDIKSGEAVSGLKKVGKAADRADNKLDKAKRSGVKMSSALKGGGAAAAAGIGMSIAAIGSLIFALKEASIAARDMTKDVVDSVNNLNDLSARSGVAAGTIQALSTAFGASGIEASKAQGFIDKMPKLYADLATEGSRAARAAEQLGVSLSNTDGTMKTADQLLIEITKSLQNVGDDTQRATVAFSLFGRSAGDILQAFGKTAPMESFMNLTREFGVQVGPEASQAASEFQVQLSVLDVVLAGLKQKFVNATGGVSLFNNGLRNAIAFSVAFQEMIDRNEDSFAQLGNAMANIAELTFQMFRDMMMGIAFMIDHNVKMIVMDLMPVVLLLKEIGAISDETSKKITEGLTESVRTSTAAVDVTWAFRQLDVGSSAKAKDALTDLDEILKGIDATVNPTVIDMDALAASIEDAGTSASESGKMIRDAAGRAYDTQLAAFDQLVANTKETFLKMDMTPLEREILDLGRTIQELEKAIVFYDESGMQTLETEQLKADAQRKYNDLLVQSTNSLDQASSALEGFISIMTSSIQSIASPDSFLRSLPGIMEASIPLIEAGASKAAQLSTDLAMKAIDLGSGAKAGLAAKAAGKASSLAGGLTAAAGGLAAAGPIVAAVGGLSIALAKLGQSSVAEIDEKFDTFLENMKKGIKILPKIVSEVLPEFLAGIAGTLVFDLTRMIPVLLVHVAKGVVMLIPHLINEIVLFIADIFKKTVNLIDGIKSFIQLITTKDGWKQIGEQIVQAIKDQLQFSREFLKDAFSMRSGGRYIPAARGGLRFTGSDEGIAMLHRGEFVVPESNVTPQAVDRRLNREMGGGINLTINADIVEGSAIDELVRKIEERFGTFGASTSTLFGGL